jgi:hypothetical protein
MGKEKKKEKSKRLELRDRQDIQWSPLFANNEFYYFERDQRRGGAKGVGENY